MSLDVPVPKHRFQFSLRTLLLLFIPVILLAGLGRWLFFPPPIDVAIKVERFYWFKAVDPNGKEIVGDLEAEVRITNRSRNTLWYMENPRYCLLQLVDGKWLASTRELCPPRKHGKAEHDWWSPQDSMQTVTISVAPIWEKATAMRVAVAFTTDRFMPKRHWVFSPEIRIVKKGKIYYPEMEEEASCTESLYAPTPVERDFEDNNVKYILTSPVPIPTDHPNKSPEPPTDGGDRSQKGAIPRSRH